MSESRKSLLSDSIDIVISDNSEETVKKAAELIRSGGDTGIIVRLDESITDEERKSITNDTAEKSENRLLLYLRQTGCTA